MRTSLLFAAIVALAPFAAAAQGVPPAVVNEVGRTTGSAVNDGIRSNQELIEREKDKTPAVPSVVQTPQPPQVPQPQPPLPSAPLPR